MGRLGKLFDETIALTFDIEGEDLNIEATLNLLTEQDRSKRETRRELARVFGDNIRTFARCIMQAKEKDIIDRWRGMPTRKTGATYPMMSR